MHVRRTRFAVSLMLLLFCSAISGFSQTSAPSEYQLKAAFLYNFAKFVEWPLDAFSSTNAPFVLGLFGENPFGDHLEQTVVGKEVNGHPIMIQTFSTVDSITNCHLLFISRSVKDNLPVSLKKLRKNPILTVSEIAQFTEDGGMICFVEESKKIRFRINDEAAKVAGLKISSKLLSLALTTGR